MFLKWKSLISECSFSHWAYWIWDYCRQHIKWNQRLRHFHVFTCMLIRLIRKINCCSFYTAFIFLFPLYSCLVRRKSKVYAHNILKSWNIRVLPLKSFVFLIFKYRCTNVVTLYWSLFLYVCIHSCYKDFSISFLFLSWFWLFLTSKVSIVAMLQLLFSLSILRWKKNWWKKTLLRCEMHIENVQPYWEMFIIIGFGEVYREQKCKEILCDKWKYKYKQDL